MATEKSSRPVPVMGRLEVNGHAGVVFYCPGCRVFHRVPIAGPNGWRFSGDMVRPTLEPSLLTSYRWGESQELRVCHLLLRHGELEFLGDSTHDLAGQTIPMQAV